MPESYYPNSDTEDHPLEGVEIVTPSLPSRVKTHKAKVKHKISTGLRISRAFVDAGHNEAVEDDASLARTTASTTPSMSAPTREGDDRAHLLAPNGSSNGTVVADRYGSWDVQDLQLPDDGHRQDPMSPSPTTYGSSPSPAVPNELSPLSDASPLKQRSSKHRVRKPAHTGEAEAEVRPKRPVRTSSASPPKPKKAVAKVKATAADSSLSRGDSRRDAMVDPANAKAVALELFGPSHDEHAQCSHLIINSQCENGMPDEERKMANNLCGAMRGSMPSVSGSPEDDKACDFRLAPNYSSHSAGSPKCHQAVRVAGSTLVEYPASTGLGCSSEETSDSESECSSDLELPSTEAVRHEVDVVGAHKVTFLDIALTIIKWLEAELSSRASELRFIRDCLRAGHAKTQLPCAMSGENESASPMNAKLRRAYTGEVEKPREARRTSTKELERAARRASQSPARRSTVRKSSRNSRAPGQHNGTVPTSEDNAEPEVPVWRTPPHRGAMFSMKQDGKLRAENSSCPWMGPPVPRWPLVDLDLEKAALIEKEMLFSFNLWNFDIFQFAKVVNNRPLQFVAYEALCRGNVFTEFNISAEKAATFVRESETRYSSIDAGVVPYHNNCHAADVTQSAHALMNDIGVGKYFDPMDVLGIIIAAVIHDMGHPGTTNVFHVNRQSDLAIRYNDRSVLESFHAAEGFRLLTGVPEANILVALTPKQKKVFRDEVISMVLGTDMSKHFEHLGFFKGLTVRHGTNEALWHQEEKPPARSIDALRIMLLHTADLANPAKGVALALEWTERIIQEMFAQGDEEKVLGLDVSALCDRVTTNIPSMQVGFIDFLVNPSMEAIAEVAPRVHDICLVNLKLTRDVWHELSKAEPDTEKEKKIKDK